MPFEVFYWTKICRTKIFLDIIYVRQNSRHPSEISSIFCFCLIFVFKVLDKIWSDKNSRLMKFLSPSKIFVNFVRRVFSDKVFDYFNEQIRK